MKQFLVVASLLLALLLTSSRDASASVVSISEIAHRGTGDDVCNGEDWVELINNDDEDGGDDGVVDLTGYVLHDDKGSTHPDAMVFSEGTTLEVGEYLVLCGGDADFAFGIGSDDAVTLLDAAGEIVDSVSLDGGGPDSYAATTYARVDGEFVYTNVTTPGEANVFSPPVAKPSLEDLEEAGRDFFAVDATGVYTDVVDISITLSPENLSIMMDHPSWQEWVPFDNLSVSRVTSPDDPLNEDDDVVVASSGVGRIRVKGQSSVTIPVCMGMKNLPFSVKFDGVPFLGMENFYLRNHFADPSYMREHASLRMLEAVGLPYLRTRPAQLYLNGEYVGFYTIIEAPSQDYVMQRSFGAFDPKKTGLFKFKTASNPSNFYFFDPSTVDPDSPVPDPYAFERGRHRPEIPVLGPGKLDECNGVLFVGNASQKNMEDLYRGYVEYNMSYPVTMLELDRVGRDIGPRSIEGPMLDFLETYYDQEANLSDLVDIDQWLRNFAFMTIIVHMDSPILHINNFYLATTDEGNDGWKMVQWDHNNVMTKDVVTFCGSMSCVPKMVYLPISDPPCGNQGNLIVSRILNSEENKKMHTAYVKEYTDVFYNIEVAEELHRYGKLVAGYSVKDEMTVYESVEEYEMYELGDDTLGIDGEFNPFLPNLRLRLGEVQKQLDAIENGVLPRDGEYDPRSICVDWRNPDPDLPPSALADDCANPDECWFIGWCHEFCGPDGEFPDESCKPPNAPSCESCFPYSRCGSGGLSSTFVPSDDACGPELAECAAAAGCFDHHTGTCAFDGEILVSDAQCPRSCAPCFPNSRCGSGGDPVAPPEEIDDGAPPDGTTTIGAVVAATEDDDDSGVFTPDDDACGVGYELCREATACFDHAIELCAEDGSFTDPLCDAAVPCKPCFPNSRCGTTTADDDSAVVGEVVEGEGGSEQTANEPTTTAETTNTDAVGSTATADEDPMAGGDSAVGDNVAGEEPEQKVDDPAEEDDGSGGTVRSRPNFTVHSIAASVAWMMIQALA